MKLSVEKIDGNTGFDGFYKFSLSTNGVGITAAITLHELMDLKDRLDEVLNVLR